MQKDDRDWREEIWNLKKRAGRDFNQRWMP